MNAPALKLQATPLRQVNNVKSLLMNQEARDHLAAVATRHMNPERMMRVVANAIRTTPKLGQCEPLSFLGALMQCASLGLEPNTVLGHVYLIPFDKSKKVKDPDSGREAWIKVPEVQVIIGYKGLIDLARRSGHITSISANIHYSDDEMWLYEEGTEAQLRHRPGPQAGKKLHAYAIAKFKDGGHAYAVLPWAQVLKTRNDAQGWQQAVRTGKTADSPWSKHEDEMAKKTAVRAMAKYLPMSVENSDLADAMQIDGAQADYRGFAIDPTQGVNLEDDGEIVEGEAAAAEPAKVTDERATQRPVEQAQQREKAPAQRQRRDDTPYTDMREGEQSADQERAQPDMTAQFQSIVDRIAGDLLDDAKPEDLLKGFATEIAAMKVQAPGIYENLKAEIAGHAPDLIGTF